MICLAFYFTFRSEYTQTSRNKQIIRTRLPQGRSGSDYIALVRETGLEPVQENSRYPLKVVRLPIPPLSHSEPSVLQTALFIISIQFTKIKR